jgi:meiotic recombination protein SPO11
MFKTQETVNRQVNNICTMLDVQEQDLGVMATAKGLILGDLQIEFKNGDIVDCIRVQQVPQNVSEIKTFITKTAEFVLIVEKDTVFQKFMNDPMGREFCANMILITGKGYPDISTRLLVKRINDILTKIPIFILVDADPYGIEIMCTYKFGSFSKIFNAEQFAVPSIRYIGMWPSDMDNMNCMVSDATPEDLKKTDEILERPYVCGRLREELFWLKTRKKKAEIECLYEQSMSYLFNNYIPTKIVNLEPLEIETQQLSQKMQDFNG